MLKHLLKKIIYGHKSDSDSYIKYFRNLGMKIGQNTVIFDTKTIQIDETRPWLVEIGDQVQITSGVTILTHGYDWSVLNGVYGDILGSSGKVKIGNNVFIGMHSTILKGVTVGDNVIIGANSLVNKDIPSNVVVGGVPAKVIMSLDDYYNKRLKCQKEEAIVLAQEYYKQYQKKPPKSVFREFFWLFENHEKCFTDISFEKIMHITGNYNNTLKKFLSTDKQFKNFEEFLEECHFEKLD